MSGHRHRPAVFDCFLILDELLLLEFRLRLLSPVVDYFVIVESDTTFQGNAKPLFFHEHRSRFAAWTDKIIHVVVSDGPETDARWERERHQRRAVLRGLTAASPQDLVLLSDVDEIPSPAVVRELAEAPPTEGHVALAMEFMNFCVDLRSKETWTRAKACLLANLSDPETLRNSVPPEPTIQNAGWHLSWLLPEETAVRKLEAYSHTEYNAPHIKSKEHIRRCRSLGVGLTGGYLLWPVAHEDMAPPIQELARLNPSLVHGPRGRWVTVVAACYRVNIWGARFLPTWLADKHPVPTFLISVVLRVATYPAAFVRRRFRRRRGLSPDLGLVVPPP